MFVKPLEITYKRKGKSVRILTVAKALQVVKETSK
jgi:hypothetical protein